MLDVDARCARPRHTLRVPPVCELPSRLEGFWRSSSKIKTALAVVTVSVPRARKRGLQAKDKVSAHAVCGKKTEQAEKVGARTHSAR